MNLCPRCGGMAQENAVFCPYCGVQLPQEPQPNVHTENYTRVTDHSQTIVNNYYNAPPQQETVVHYIPVALEKPKKKHTFMKIMGWLFVFPLMVTLIAGKKRKWYWWLIAFISWIVYLVMLSRNDSATVYSLQPMLINSLAFTV